MDMIPPAESRRWVRSLETVLFSSKWVLLPFYFGLVLALVYYGGCFFRELWHFFHSWGSDKDTITARALELVDMAMIGNLMRMILAGSYTSFVNKAPFDSSERSSSGLLKVKLATSLVGVASIHLLQRFVSGSLAGPGELRDQLAIYSAFVLGALTQAAIDWLHHHSERHHSAPKHENSTR